MAGVCSGLMLHMLYPTERGMCCMISSIDGEGSGWWVCAWQSTALPTTDCPCMT
jgi:hypothetical protein